MNSLGFLALNQHKYACFTMPLSKLSNGTKKKKTTHPRCKMLGRKLNIKINIYI